MDDKKPLQRIKTGAWARTWSLSRLTVGATARAAGHAVGSLFASDDEKSRRSKELLKSQLTALTQELGQLKGSAMKAGQMLSMLGEHFLPPEANRILKTLQSQSPPMAYSALEAVLLAELGSERLAELEVDPQPTAAASLGQVHRARHRPSGRDLAVKVQYPGVDAAVAADLRVLRRILRLSKLLPRGLDYDGLFAELKSMLEQEADYCQELTQTQWFATALRDDPRYVVPQACPELCSRHVLTTSFEVGLPIDGPEVQGLEQARRNALGLAALDLYMRELWEFGRVQTDPHFGNYRVRVAADAGGVDQLIALDFGAVRQIPEAYRDGYGKLVAGACRSDRDQVIAGARQLQFLPPTPEPDLENFFVELCALITEPFAEPTAASAHLFDATGHYDWGRSDLPRRLARRGAEVAFKLKLRAPPRESLFLDRKLGGMFIFLAALKVQIRGRDVVARYLSI